MKAQSAKRAAKTAAKKLASKKASRKAAKKAASKVAAKKLSAAKAAQKTAKKKPANLLRAADMARLQEALAKNGAAMGVRMGKALGLASAVDFVRIPPGAESPASAARAEEWVYVLYGQGAARIEGREFEIGMGDFLAFPAPILSHQLRNTGFEDLVYLGGAPDAQADVKVARK
ncbi:MAG: cupin domain-containing protein [Hyphomonadaceae bacterium]